MSGRDDQEEHNQNEEADQAENGETDDLSERISEALAPTLSDMSVRVAEAVAKSLSDQPVTDSENEQEDADSDPDEPDSDDGDDDTEHDEPGKSAPQEDSNDRSFIGQAAASLRSSFLSSLFEEGGEQLESLVDTGVDMMFTRSARAKVRALADQTLQAVLHDILSDIDDPEERIPLYRDSLTRLRPIVRDAVDAMFTEDSKLSLKRRLHAAVPSVVHGDFDTAFHMVTEAFSEITDYAEEVIWNNSGDVVRVVQQISTELLEESIEDAAEDKINPQEIQQRVQEKADEAREKLRETVGSLQEGVRSAQGQLGEKTGGMQRRSGGGMPPTGTPPGTSPPSGMPPSGRPPSGRPPSGRPPSGAPPNGVHPAVRRMNDGGSNGSRNPRPRRLPEA